MTEPLKLSQLMTESAQDAICYMKQLTNVEIGLDASSIPQLDIILAELAQEHEVKPLDNQMLFTVSTMLGAFVGEIFKSQLGGEWFMDQSDPNAPFIVLNYGGRSYPFASVCFEKIVNDPKISVLTYYELALNNGTSSD